MPLHPIRLLLGMHVVVFASTPARLSAQASITAEKTQSLSAFAGISHVAVGYSSDVNIGYTVGGLYTRHTRWRVDPSLELRGNFSPGSNLTETTGLMGVRLERPIARFRPYVNFLAGLGTISFAHPAMQFGGRLYRHDGSVVYNFGGGVQFALTPRWSTQVEYQQQRWNLGPQPEVLFSPGLFSVGVVYHLPFRPYQSR